MNKTKLNEIKDKIQEINPSITDELLNFLHDYFSERQSISLEESLEHAKNDKGFSDLIKRITLQKYQKSN